MKMVSVKCTGDATYSNPIPIATGVAGGGYVGISYYYGNNASEFIGTKECLADVNQAGRIYQGKEHVFYLNEGESLYGKSAFAGSNNSTTYNVTYYNTAPSSQQAPINLTGTIQLNQQ